MQIVEVLKLASERVPAVNYAIGLSGLAAVAAIIIGFVGSTQNAILIIFLVLIGAVLLFIFALATQSNSRFMQIAAIVFIWAILLCFIAFLFMTISAFAVGKPCSLVYVFGISGDQNCGQGVVKSCLTISTIKEYWECATQ